VIRKNVDRLDALEAFVVTVERGSLSAAARATGRSITAISRALTELEARLGVQLLLRTTRSLKLTDAGGRYLEVCRRVLSELALAQRAENAALESPQGLLTVTAPLMFGALHVRPIVDMYLAANTDVRARLLLLDRVVNVVDEGVDVAFRIAHLPDSALVATALGHVRRVVCASPDYLARHGRPREPRDLTRHRCITFSALTPTETWSFGAGPEGGRIKQVKIRPVLSVNTAEAAIASASGGLGVTSALSYQVAEAIGAGALVPLLTSYEPEPLPVHLVQPAGATRAAKVRAFVELATPRLRAVLVEQPKKQPVKQR
jgi:DNA-binding transcriptional LysR family regulator